MWCLHRLEAGDGGPLVDSGRSPYPCWMTLHQAERLAHSHFHLSSTNGLGWFKEMKQEVLAHLTHLAGTAVEHAYVSSSTAKPLQEDHGQQQGKQHCRSQGMANSTHRVTCTATDLQVCVDLTQSRSGSCRKSLTLAWKCLTWCPALPCQPTGCPSFRQSPGLKEDFKKEENN